MDEATALFLTTRVYKWAGPLIDSDRLPTHHINPAIVFPAEWAVMDRLERLRLLVGNVNPAVDFPELWSTWSSGRALEQPTCPESLWWPPIEAELRRHKDLRMGVVHTECLRYLAMEWTPRDLHEAISDGVRALLRKEVKCAESGASPPIPTNYVLGCVKRAFERRQQALQEAQAARLPEFMEVPL